MASPNAKLTPAEVAVLETFVVPRYLKFFGTMAVDAILAGDSARIVHLGCRTGYPDRQLISKVSNCAVFGIDPSLAALELARNKAATLGEASLDYRVAVPEQSGLPSEVFSHALMLHPVANRKRRLLLWKEMQRLVYTGGQAIIALPLAGSFQEVLDLFREYALKYDDTEFADALERAMLTQPTVDSLSEELGDAGFDDVYVAQAPTELEFEKGRAFVEDPVTRLLVFPSLQVQLESAAWTAAVAYLQEAISRYFSEDPFTLTVNVGCASCRRL